MAKETHTAKKGPKKPAVKGVKPAAFGKLGEEKPGKKGRKKKGLGAEMPPMMPGMPGAY